METPGPVFFKQTRVGLNGRHFTMWKFRSMGVNAEAVKSSLSDQNEMENGVLFKMKNDPRIIDSPAFFASASILHVS